MVYVTFWACGDVITEARKEAENLAGHYQHHVFMLLEHFKNYALGMDALLNVCSWNTNGSLLWA